MRSLLIIAIVAIFTLTLYSQTSQDLLKTAPYSNELTPEWALEMYKDNPNVFLVDRLYEQFYKTASFTKNIHTQNYKHWRKLIDPYVLASGFAAIPSHDDQRHVLKGIKNKKQLLQKSGNPWNVIGPLETFSTDDNQVEVSWQCNVYTIDQSKSDENIVFAGTEAGGIFKSIDKGNNWQMVSANALVRTIRSIKIHPTDANIVYAGDGAQVYKTIDGGANWEAVFFMNNLNVNDISIHQSDPNVVLVASNIGLYRSGDGGANFEMVLNETIWDVEQNTADPSQFYILRSNSDAIKTEFWKSTDHGLSFSLKEQGWYQSDDPNRINGGARMTVTEADANRIYVILVGASKPGDNGYIGIYKSEDAGESWALTAPPIGGPYDDNHPNLATLNNTNTLQQGYYNLGIAASDEDADIVLIGCLNLWRTTDGGETFEALGGYQGNVSWIHPDQQEIEINGNDMWVANDGGINYSNDYFSTHESKKKGLFAADYWGFGSGWNDDLLVGGRYHNGNSAYRPSFEDGQFLRLGGGEAPTGYVQPGGDQVAFFSDISAKVIPHNLSDAVTNVAGLSMFPFESYFAANYSELLFDPNCYSHMLLGRENKLYKSTDNGNTFDLLATLGEADDPVMQLEWSRVDNDVIYAYQRTTFYGAVVWVTLDGGNTWAQKDFPSEVSSMRSGTMTISSTDLGTLWVAFSHQTNDGSKIYKTTDYGDTWTNLTTSDLDGERIQTIVHHEGTDHDIYIGTDFGVYYHDGNSWSACDNGLPMRTNSNKLLPFYKENKLRVATYGNGIWETDLVQKTAPIAQATVDKLVSNCARDTFYFDDYSVLLQDADVSWEWVFSPAPIFISDANARNPKVVFGATGNFDVSLTVSNTYGSNTFQKAQMINVIDDLCSPDIYPGEALACYQNGNDFVQLPSLNRTLEAFTFSAWVKPNGIQSDYTGIIFNDDISTGLNFSTNNQLGFHYQDAGSAAWAWQSGLTVPTDVWSHVAMVADANGVTVYLNGIPARRDLTLVPAIFETLKIGSYKGWTSRNYNGLIDEVTIWDRALTEKEIREHRHITKTLSNAPGLISYYQFNEEDGRVIDRIGLNHGNLSGLSERSPSFAPVGGGTAEGIYGIIGETAFETEDISINTQTDLEDMIVVSKLEIAPQNEMVPDIFPLDQYWIINSYGDFLAAEVRFENVALEDYYGTNASEILLYSRSENDSETNFFALQNGESAIPGADGQIQFIDLPNLSAQLILSKASISSTDAIDEKQKTLLFPNPTAQQAQIKSELTWKRIAIYDSKGNLVSDELLDDKKIKGISTLAAGVYYYVLSNDNKMKTGRIVKVK